MVPNPVASISETITTVEPVFKFQRKLTAFLRSSTYTFSRPSKAAKHLATRAAYSSALCPCSSLQVFKIIKPPKFHVTMFQFLNFCLNSSMVSPSQI
jgi:hypothetical protein